jgi:GTP-binding protein HflX
VVAIRRHLVVREKKIKARLELLQKTRKLHRKSRKKQGIPTIAILGYTNAGSIHMPSSQPTLCL